MKECSKVQNCGRDLIAAIKKIQAVGIQVLGGYIVGFDNDDEGIFSRQIKFIQESGVVTAMVGLLNAAPNTRLWHRLKAENRLVVNLSGDNTDGTINFNPSSDVQVWDTTVAWLDTTVSPVSTFASVTDTTLTAWDTNASVTDTQCTVKQPAP